MAYSIDDRPSKFEIEVTFVLVITCLRGKFGIKLPRSIF